MIDGLSDVACYEREVDDSTRMHSAATTSDLHSTFFTCNPRGGILGAGAQVVCFANAGRLITAKPFRSLPRTPEPLPILSLNEVADMTETADTDTQEGAQGIGERQVANDPPASPIASPLLPVEREDHRLELLMNYTIFHIGLYMTLVGAVIASEAHDLFGPGAIVVSILCFLLAGACGGIIAVNIAEYDVNKSSISYFFQGCRLRAWFFKRGWGIPYELTARVEHGAFWIGVLVLIASYFSKVQWVSSLSPG